MAKLWMRLKGWPKKQLSCISKPLKNLDTKKLVVVPYHKKDLPKGTLLEILKQAGISREEVLALLEKRKKKDFPNR
jgi:hypothetical protein